MNLNVMFHCCLALALLTSTARAVTTSWTVGNGAYLSLINWDNGVPGSDDVAAFDRGSAFTYTVTFSQPGGADIIADRVVVGSNTVTFNPGAGAPDYILDNTSTAEVHPVLFTPVRGITIGVDGNDTAAVLVSRLSLLQAVAATLGHAGGSSGTLTLNQDGDLLDITGASSSQTELIIGRLGTGILNVSAGADVHVNGVNAAFNLGDVSLGRYVNSQGTANISGSGSTLETAGPLVVGEGGTGTLNITAGGTVESLNGIVGDLASSTGSSMISGAGSTWDTSNLVVGGLGDGTLDILNGGAVTNANGYVGGQAGSTGIVTVDGTSSLWSNSANLTVGDAGTGTLTIQNSGAVEVAGGLSINSLSTVDLLGGTLRTSTLTGGENLNWTGGTLELTGSNFLVKTGGTLGNAVTLGPTMHLIASNFGIHSIGGPGTGFLTVNGGSADFVAGDLHVGESSGLDGTLIVTAGGTVTSAKLHIGSDGSTGSVTVDGVGSMLTNDLHVGSDGNGTLQISGGGVVSNGGDCYIGSDTGSIGVATVDGVGSKLTGSNVLFVGWAGNGTLQITGGGVVSNSIGAIGYDPGSTGVVTVDGLDSKWMHSGDLYVGYSGTGTLSVQNGASVQATNLLVNNMSAIHGDGTITGNVKNDGLVAPGTSPGALSITGNYTQFVNGDLLLELASVSTYDQLLVTGNVDLDGTVQVTLLGGFMPVSGDSFNILDFGSFTDSSYSLMLPALATGLQWDTSQFEIAGEISVTRLGDHNFDDSVDAADYVAWRKFDGLQPGYDVWRTHFGESAGGGAGAAFGSPDAAVPEPGVVGLLALAVAGLRFVRCGRPKCTV